MKSIRRYLIISLIIALSSGSVLVSIFTYFNTIGEINELYDKNMIELADTLKSQLTALNREEHHIKNTLGAASNTKIREEQEFLIQVWNKNGESVYRSHRAIPFPFQEKPGAGTREFNGEIWRTYGTQTQDFTIQVSQPQKARNRFVREIALHLLVPLLLLIPVVGFFIWLAVGRSLMPLNSLSAAITKRSASSLAPLPETHIPVEIRPLVRELNELLIRLDRSLGMQRRFTADAAHELRTPLTALQLQLGNLKRAETDTDRAHHMAKLQKGIDRATQLVKQLLTLARMEPDAMKTQMEAVDLVALAQEAVKQHAEMVAQKPVHLEIFYDQPVSLSANAEHLHILLENLLSNALRYTPAGGVVHVHIGRDAGHAILKVQDNGIGIPAGEREKVFERFHRVLGTQVEGTGLGLSIAKHIAEQHHGTIRIEDGIRGEGVSFIVTFALNLQL